MADGLIIPGGPALARALRRLPGLVAETLLERAAVAGMMLVLEAAIEKAPRGGERRRPGTPPLASTIRLAVQAKTRASVRVDVGTKVAYAIPLEFGHQVIARGPSRAGLGARPRNDTLAQGRRRRELRAGLNDRRRAGSMGFVAARPFLRPAGDEMKERVIETTARVLGAGVEAEFRRVASEIAA